MIKLRSRKLELRLQTRREKSNEKTRTKKKRVSASEILERVLLTACGAVLGLAAARILGIGTVQIDYVVASLAIVLVLVSVCVARANRMLLTQQSAIKDLLEQRLDDKIADIRQEVSNLRKALSDIENRVSDLAKRVEEQAREVRILEAKIASSTETVEKRLSELSREVQEVSDKQRDQNYAILVKTLSDIQSQLAQVLECLRQYAAAITKTTEKR